MADPAVVDSIANNIASLESGGHDDPYSVEGPRLPSGDRAYGRYQIMGNNIPSWSEEAGLGRLSPRQFISDPFVQDKVAKHQIAKLHDKYGNARDVASIWHSGVPYDRAAAEGRRDKLGTHTTDYAAHVAKGIDPDGAYGADTGAALDTTLPLDMPDLATQQAQAPAQPQQPATTGIDPQAVLKDAKFWALEPNDRVGVMKQVDPKFASLNSSDQMAVLDRMNPHPQTQAAPTAPTPEAPSLATNINKAMGVADDHPLGSYAADVIKPLGDAAKDFVTGASNITHPQGFRDALNSFLQIIHPLGVTGEIAGNVVFRAATDAGLSPDAAAGLATTANMGVGMLTPIPGGSPAARMPLQGSAVTRDAAAEAAAAAERATQWASKAKEVGAEATATAAKTSEQAGADAAAAASRVEPSPDVAARAKAALTPADVTAEQGGQVIKEGLKTELAQQKEAVGGIYDAFVAEHGAEPRTDPTRGRELSEMIDAARDAFVDTWKGKTGDILDKLQARIAQTLKGEEPLTVDDYNQVKTQLDGLLRGGAKTQKNTLLNQINMKIRDTIRAGASGDDAEWLAAADHLWKTELAGREMTQTSLGKIVNLVKKSDPKTVVSKLFGNGTSDEQAAMAQAVMKRLDSTDTGAAEAIRQANFDRLLQPDAAGNLDPAELLKRYDAWHKDFRSTMTTPGAKTFFDLERGAQTAAETTASAAKGAEKAATSAGKAAEKEAATTARVAEKATADAATAAEAAKAPNKLATMTARGLKIAGAGVTEALASHLGFPYLGGAAGVAELLIPTDHLAALLANSKTANIMARMLKTPANSAVIPALLQQLRSSELGKKLLSSPAGQRKQEEAQGMMAEIAP